MTAQATPLLEVRGLAKRYPGVVALKGADLAFQAGEVHAIVGANGAGKSTLMNLLSGAITPSAGDILIDGKRIELTSPAVALQLGIATVYQEFSLVPQLTVAENIYLGNEPDGRSAWLDRRRMVADTEALFGRYRIPLDPRAPTDRLSVAEQQLVEIARALSMRSRILILDEPTAVLSLAEQKKLFAIIAALKSTGLLILYVSHRLEEILAIADRATALRDGEAVATRAVLGLTIDDLVHMMIGPGSSRGERAPAAMPHAAGRFDITYRMAGKEWRIALRGGEIVGLAGLVGAGRTTFARALAGDPHTNVTAALTIDGEPCRFRSPRSAVKSGVIYLTEDRKRDGVFANLSVVLNAAAGALGATSHFGLRRPREERRLASDMLSRLRLVARSLDMPIRQLSGGNQQKVILSRALLGRPRLLICDEPTRGIDIRAKDEIHAILQDLAQTGISILVISSEIEELLTISHRILVMRDQKLVAEFPATGTDEITILRAASGGT
jgi:ABC-type sugar transport system ATPase subunit